MNTNIDDIKFTGKKILIVDDIKLNYLFIEAILKESKAELIWADTAIKAINYLKNNEKIDLILMDIQMPDINGYEALKTIKKLKKNIPIIAQTSCAMIEDMNKCINEGFNDYISKPIIKESFYTLLLKYL